MRTNCLVFAFLLWIRGGLKNGWIGIRQSDHWPGPHFAYFRRCQDGQVRMAHYQPKEPLDLSGGKWLLNARELLRFNGKVTKRRDPYPEEKE